MNGLPLKATGTILDHRLCSQQSVYDARTTSRIKVRIHYIRDWVVDYAPPVNVWLITDWAWYRCALDTCCNSNAHCFAPVKLAALQVAHLQVAHCGARLAMSCDFFQRSMDASCNALCIKSSTKGCYGGRTKAMRGDNILCMRGTYMLGDFKGFEQFLVVLHTP